MDTLGTSQGILETFCRCVARLHAPLIFFFNEPTTSSLLTPITASDYVVNPSIFRLLLTEQDDWDNTPLVFMLCNHAKQGFKQAARRMTYPTH
jgi:hypothetical protein